MKYHKSTALFFSFLASFFLIFLLVSSCSLKPSGEKQTAPSQQKEKIYENPVIDEGALLEDFENINEWVIGKDNASQLADYTFKKNGNQGLRLNAVGGKPAYSTKKINLDLKQVNNFIFGVYVHDLSSLSSIGIYFSSTNDWSKYFSKIIEDANFKEGWNEVVLSKEDFGSSGGERWENVMVMFKLKCEPKAAKNSSVTFDDFRLNYKAKAVVIINFDDGFNSVYDRAYPILFNNQQRATVFVITSRVGKDPYMSKEKLEFLRNDGWDIANHSKSHLELTTFTLSEMEVEINDGYKWLAENGFGNTAGFFAYPFGKYNDAVIKKVKEKHQLGRSVIDGYYQPHLKLNDDDLAYLIKAMSVTQKTSVQKAKDRINKVIEQNGLLVLLFHSLADDKTESDEEYLTSDFKQISDYLKTKQDAGLLEVMTLSDYYQAISKN